MSGFIVLLFCAAVSVVCGVEKAMQIVMHPADIRARVNSTVTLQCRVRKAPRMKFYWTHNGFYVDLVSVKEYSNGRYSFPGPLKEGYFDLQIKRLRLFDDAKYKCQYNSPLTRRPVESNTATVTVLVRSQKPVIRQLEPKRSGKSGRILSDKEESQWAEVMEKEGSLKLQCEAKDGRPAATIKWYYSGLVVTPNSLQPPLKDVEFQEVPSLKTKLKTRQSTLVLSGLKRSHHRVRIACEAISEGYESYALKTATYLSVLYGPEVRISDASPRRPNNQYTENDVVELRCEAQGRPNKFSWTWSQVRGEGGHVSQISGAVEPILRVRMIRELDGYYIRCSATARSSSYSDYGPLRVHYGPRVTVPLPLYPASIGDDKVILKCQAQANPPPHIEWRRKGKPQVLSRTSTLELRNLRAEDFGEYVCEATSQSFTPAQGIVWLAKKSPPRITSSPVQYARTGLSVKIVCDILSVPKPLWTRWTRNGRKLPSSSRYSITRNNVLGGVKYIFYISEVRGNDFGVYNCTVKNSKGEATQGIKLTPKDEVPIAFVAGASIAIVMIAVFMAIVLCACRRGVCERKYSKANMSERNGEAVPGLNMSPESSPAKHAGVVLEDDPWIQGMGTLGRNVERELPDGAQKTYYRYSTEFDDSTLGSLPRTCEIHGYRGASFGGYTPHHHLANGTVTGYLSNGGISHFGSGPSMATASANLERGGYSGSGGGTLERSHHLHQLAAGSMPLVPERDEELYRDESTRSCDSGYGGPGPGGPGGPNAGGHVQVATSAAAPPGAPTGATSPVPVPSPRPFSYTQGCLLPTPQKGIVSLRLKDANGHVDVTEEELAAHRSTNV